jgi:hypothetical protein
LWFCWKVLRRHTGWGWKCLAHLLGDPLRYTFTWKQLPISSALWSLRSYFCDTQTPGCRFAILGSSVHILRHAVLDPSMLGWFVAVCVCIRLEGTCSWICKVQIHWKRHLNLKRLDAVTWRSSVRQNNNKAPVFWRWSFPPCCPRWKLAIGIGASRARMLAMCLPGLVLPSGLTQLLLCAEDWKIWWTRFW